MNSFLEKRIQAVKLKGFRDKREEFYEQMAKSYESKELLKDFLTAELKISKDKNTRDDSRAYALMLMKRRLGASEDADVSTVLAAAVPDEDKLMLSAVKEAQDKPAVLRCLADAIRSQRAMKSLINKAVIPPLVVLPGVFFFCYVLANKLIPMAVKMAPPEVWTPFNSFVRVFAETVGGHAFEIIGVIAVLVGITRYFIPRWTGKLRSKLESVRPGLAMLLMPICPILVPLSIYRDAQAGLMLSALAVFLQSGRTLNDALKAMAKASNPWMRWHIRKIVSHLEVAPTEYVKAFSKGLLSPALLARLASTIRTNPRFDQVLIYVGTTGTVEIRNQVESQSKKINGLVLLSVGAMVLTMFLGQMSITSAVQDELQPSKIKARQLMAKQKK